MSGHARVNREATYFPGENTAEVQAATRRILSAERPDTSPTDDSRELGGLGSWNPVCRVCGALLPWEHKYRVRHEEWHEKAARDE